ncbi:hypothetical protein [uncultured Cohaesibacter sp.]|uniref:hypothetical protein n=1 Tax=uncultured Cohaesibacter sp. TaxID=1002546 RepID=UPI0029C7DBB7|nr:hypothetical protein [uncultured Cohaesibacter sp.]
MTRSKQIFGRGLVASAALLMAVPLAVAHPNHHRHYSDAGYQDDAPVVAALPTANGKVYLEATYDHEAGVYVYPERIKVSVDPYQPPVSYRAKRVIYDGYTPVVPLR